MTLAGLRVRTRVSVSRVERLIVLQSPELLSTFEGLGAKVKHYRIPVHPSHPLFPCSPLLSDTPLTHTPLVKVELPSTC
jgi:hypothetical protein